MYILYDVLYILYEIIDIVYDVYLQVYRRLSEVLGLNDESMVLSVFIGKM